MKTFRSILSLYLLIALAIFSYGCGTQPATLDQKTSQSTSAPVSDKTPAMDIVGGRQLIWQAYQDVLAEVGRGAFPVDAEKAKVMTQGKETEFLFVDLRSRNDYAVKHVKGAVNLSILTLADTIEKLPSDRTLVLYCYTGQSSALAMAPLKAYGYRAIFINGGFSNLETAGFAMDAVKTEFTPVAGRYVNDPRTAALNSIKNNLLAIARQHSLKTLVISQADTKELVEGSPEKYAFVDLRPKEDYERGHIKSSISAPLTDLQKQIPQLPRDKRLILCCKSGQLAAMTTAPLTAEGFKIISLCDGFSQVDEKKFPLEKQP